MSSDLPTVQLGHGGGGSLSHDLIRQLLVPAFGPADGVLHDAAVLPAEAGPLAFSTDAYVVRPLLFPGGDIGSLAVFGTVNDLAMVGASAFALSLSLILEEGLPMATLHQVVASIRLAAQRCAVPVVTGDTKVVERGKGDGIFISTAGIGRVEHGLAIGPAAVRPGDAILVSGDLGRHGVAILAARQELGFRTDLHSDLAPLHEPVQALLEEGLELHCLRDLTRGGLASALHELSAGARLGMLLQETAIPVAAEVEGACELLGLDPLAMANEGRFVLFLPADQAGRALDLLRRFQPAAAIIGTVAGEAVLLQNSLGLRRRLELGQGEQLPRIC
ncbi:hydrogenase expression/formation protein HypE [Synechococcus sp. CS-1325]|uniref:hydrogenase expression/formation protein HypE n=1 Tax=Synechococcus sp. CS-1325 TaxID=2847979 RepID=UPI000DB67417|nr:hydrogenase expression/formation protein HypE [Synechococcus sp. CS-1325]MCT0200377.1 hydrogenase expression/formation protein HypE [Synechococcus sp. CS-1325]PZU97032.1 MAG: hydrogenase expression/formation protein HypE [Cyanobium sp.]